MNTALLTIATGEKYWQYARPLFESAKKYFVPHEAILLTDCPHSLGADYQGYQKHSGYPETTLKRYHSFLGMREMLEKDFTHLFYIDIDALFVASVGEEIFSDGITATLHHGFVGKPLTGTLEHNPRSAAYMEDARHYFCGGFNGGTSAAYLDMAEAIREGVDYDSRQGITAIWHDESHLNKYLSIYPPAKILGSQYCYPEHELNRPNNAKIVCLEKAWRGGR